MGKLRCSRTETSVPSTGLGFLEVTFIVRRTIWSLGY